MKKIYLGEKKENIVYDFRETCFGIVLKDNEFYLTEKHNDISLIGGGIEEGESHIETLKREFMEEAGLTILECSNFITIDCFWKTRDNKDMESLSNFYIVKVSDNIVDNTEQESKLVKIPYNEILDKIVLPYQKQAIELFLDKKNNGFI